MGVSFDTICGVRLGFEIVTPSMMQYLDADGEFKWCVILDLLIFRLVLSV